MIRIAISLLAPCLPSGVEGVEQWRHKILLYFDIFRELKNKQKKKNKQENEGKQLPMDPVPQNNVIFIIQIHF